MAPVRQFLAVFPGRKIYLQPLGEIPAETLDSAAGLIRKELGIDCVVRPALPLPLEESYDHGRHQSTATGFPERSGMRRAITRRTPCLCFTC